MSGGVFFSFTSLPASCFGFPLYLWFCLSDPKLSSVYYTSSTESDSDETRARRDTTNWHVCELRVHKERGLLLHRDDGSIGGRRAIARDAACFDWRRLAAFVFTGGCFFCLLFVHACFPQCLYSQWYGYITSLYFLATADGCDPLPVCSDGIASSIIPRTAASSTLLGGGVVPVGIFHDELATYKQHSCLLPHTALGRYLPFAANLPMESGPFACAPDHALTARYSTTYRATSP